MRDKFKPRHNLHHGVMGRNVKHVSLILDQCSSSSKINRTAGSVENTALHLAAKNGDIDIADMLIYKGANLHQRNKNGMTALHIAAQHRHHKLLKLLLSRGSNINDLTVGRMTSLHIAVHRSSKFMVEDLLDSGANVRTQNILGNTPLHDALKRRCKDVIKQLVTNGAPIHFRNNKGETVLHIACLYCDKEIVELLLNKGADCNALTADGSTCLHYAVNNVRYSADLVPLLIETGAAAWVMNRAGEAPFTIAIKQAVKWYSCEFLGYLLGKGLDFDEPVGQSCLNYLDDIDNETITLPALSTVFTVAIKYEDIRLFELLISKGIQIDYKNQFCTTPLLEAVTSDNLHAAKVLLQLGADPNDKDSHNKSALRLAESEAMVQLLLIYNADVEEANLLHRIVKYRNSSMFNLLIEKGADINKKCSRGHSVLHYAMGTESGHMLARVLYTGVEPEEFFRIFLKSYQKLKMLHFFLMAQQVMIFYFQGISNDEIMGIVRSTKCLKIYNDFTEDQRKMIVTRICKDFPVTYYDLLMKRGEELVRILRIKQIRKAVKKRETQVKFETFAIRLRLNIENGLRRLRLESELQEELEAFIPSNVACQMSKYFNNSDLLKFTCGLREPSEDIF